ncbi:unnamed protein product [Boreogadus saida]
MAQKICHQSRAPKQPVDPPPSETLGRAGVATTGPRRPPDQFGAQSHTVESICVLATELKKGDGRENKQPCCDVLPPPGNCLNARNTTAGQTLASLEPRWNRHILPRSRESTSYASSSGTTKLQPAACFRGTTATRHDHHKAPPPQGTTATRHHRHEAPPPRGTTATRHHRHEAPPPRGTLRREYHRHEAPPPRGTTAARHHPALMHHRHEAPPPRGTTATRHDRTMGTTAIDAPPPGEAPPHEAPPSASTTATRHHATSPPATRHHRHKAPQGTTATRHHRHEAPPPRGTTATRHHRHEAPPPRGTNAARHQRNEHISGCFVWITSSE